LDTVILTGASGFIGQHCIDHLLELGFRVVACYNSADSANSLPQKKNLIWQRVNLLDTADVQKVLSANPATHMLHMAWYAEPGKFWDSRLNLDWLRASVNLLKVFTECGGGRFIGAGSCAEYDWSSNTYSENTPLNPSTLYGQCKSSLFQTGLQNATTAGIEFAWGRIFWLYGPGEDKRRLVPYVINSLLSDDEASCSEGAQIRDFMHVDDLARAFAELLKSNLQGPINIASGQGVSIKTLVQTIGRLIDKEHLLEMGAVPTKKDEPASIIADVAKLKEKLSFNPQIELEDGLLRTLEWWRTERSKASTQPIRK